MTRFLGIISGKGGVGKTTCVLNIAVALNNFGRHVVVVDGNLMMPNIGLSLGIPKFKVSLNDVLKGNGNITKTAYRHVSGVMIIPSDIKYKIAGSTDYKLLKNKIKELSGRTELVLVDGCNGIGEEAKEIIMAVDDVLVVTTPDMNSVIDALKSLSFAEENGTNVLGIIVNRKVGDNHELSLQNIEAILEKPVIGVISEDDKIRESLNLKNPVMYSHPESHASKDFKRLAAKIIGQEFKEGLSLKEELKLERKDFFQNERRN